MTTSCLLAVFDGERSSSGYSVNIQKAIISNQHVYVYAEFVKPKPSQLSETRCPQSSFSIVSIERSALPANAPLTIHLMDDATKQEVLVQEYTVK